MPRSRPQNGTALEPESLKAGNVGGEKTQVSEHLPDFAHVILGHVAAHTEGIHGYRLGRLLSRSGHHAVAPQLGQLYRMLRRLERMGLVDCHLETQALRLRYRFTITESGDACLREWLQHLPRESGATCQELLHRLQFADRLSTVALRRLLDDAAEECSRNLEAISHSSGDNCKRGQGDDAQRRPWGPYEAALKARLATDLCWVRDVQRLIHGSAPKSAKGAAAVRLRSPYAAAISARS